MLRIPLFLVALILTLPCALGQRRPVVADAVTHRPLANATVLDRKGKVAGICSADGVMPRIEAGQYPLTVRYLGYDDAMVKTAGSDTVFLNERYTSLDELVVDGGSYKALHILAYVREYSTMTTYSDTVFLFREKMVDYMVPPGGKSKFAGWTAPRILKTQSYYRYTDSAGLDSVSDECRHHFSWSDWMNLPPVHEIPLSLRGVEAGTDTVHGRYSPSEVWTRSGDRMTVSVNVIADTTARRWCSGVASFFRSGMDFDEFRANFNFDVEEDAEVTPASLRSYSYNVSSRGRGVNMFKFHRREEPFFVDTYAEVYVLDKEYITIKEAREWERHKFSADDMPIYSAADAPELHPAVLDLMARVKSIDREMVRLGLELDTRVASGKDAQMPNIGKRALSMLKALTGISAARHKRKMNKQWKDFRKDWKNNSGSHRK